MFAKLDLPLVQDAIDVTFRNCSIFNFNQCIPIDANFCKTIPGQCRRKIEAIDNKWVPLKLLFTQIKQFKSPEDRPPANDAMSEDWFDKQGQGLISQFWGCFELKPDRNHYNT
jgi:hypothetical protein